MHQASNMSTLLLSELREALWPEPGSSAPSPSSLAQVAENVARHVALNLETREDFVTTLELGTEDSEDIWAQLGKSWTALRDSFSSQAAISSPSAKQDAALLALALGKLERNLLAGLGKFQLAAVRHEPDLRGLIFHITSFEYMEDPEYHSLHAVLTQLLSNMISPVSFDPGADDLADRYLRLYLSGRREDDVIIRLLDSRDPKTNIATLHLLANLTRGSQERLSLLLEQPGLSWTSRILGRMDEWLDPNDARFELAHSLFRPIFEFALQDSTFKALATPAEPLSPTQTILLKLLDSYAAGPHPNQSPNANAFLLPLFRDLADYALASMRNVPDDARLPKVFEGLVLTTEACSSIGLACQARADAATLAADAAVVEPVNGGEEDLVRSMKSSDESIGLLKPIVEILGELNKFLPRVKPAASAPDLSQAEKRPFANLKRCLVRLLGILAYDDPAAGDLVREYGGVHLVLGLTEVDEHNPYLREHALFAVRNLMKDNPTNQAIIGQMDPIGVLGEDGQVRPIPEKMKKGQTNGH